MPLVKQVVEKPGKAARRCGSSFLGPPASRRPGAQRPARRRRSQVAVSSSARETARTFGDIHCSLRPSYSESAALTPPSPTRSPAVSPSPAKRERGPGSEAPLLAIVGPTASGKTALAVALAQRLDGEIVGADSRQLYRRLDAGTAKPTPEERRLVPHHLIDIVEPDEPFGLAQYVDLARDAIAQIRARRRLPILVGGTGQYVWALAENWEVPRVEPRPELRDAFAARAEAEGPLALHAELVLRDPAAAAQIHPHNVRRVIRALELLVVTGRPPSELRSRKGPGSATLVLGLSLPREELYGRIDRRVEAMFSSGLVEEVEALLAAGYAPGLPSLSGIGYAQVVQYLRGVLDLAAARERTKTATHRLVRQQATWFRANDARITWIESGEVDRATSLVERGIHGG